MTGNQFLSVLWRTLRRDKLALAGAAVLIALIAVALLAPLIAPYDPNEITFHNAGVAVWQRNDAWQPAREVGTETLAGVAL